MVQQLLIHRWNNPLPWLYLIHLMNWCCTMMCVHCHFQKYMHGSKRVLKTHGRQGGPKKLIGGQIQVFPTSSTRTPRHFWPKERKRLNPTRFGARFGLQHWTNLRWPPRPHPDSVLDIQVLHGILMKSIFIWIQTHIYILPEEAAMIKLLLIGFSIKGAASPYFGPMGLVSSRVQ